MRASVPVAVYCEAKNSLLPVMVQRVRKANCPGPVGARRVSIFVRSPSAEYSPAYLHGFFPEWHLHDVVLDSWCGTVQALKGKV